MRESQQAANALSLHIRAERTGRPDFLRRHPKLRGRAGRPDFPRRHPKPCGRAGRPDFLRRHPKQCGRAERPDSPRRHPKLCRRAGRPDFPTPAFAAGKPADPISSGAIQNCVGGPEGPITPNLRLRQQRRAESTTIVSRSTPRSFSIAEIQPSTSPQLSKPAHDHRKGAHHAQRPSALNRTPLSPILNLSIERTTPSKRIPDYGGALASTGVAKSHGACRGGSFPR